MRPDQFIDQRFFSPIQNPAFLNSLQTERFNRDGYLVLPQWLSSENVSAIKSEAERFFTGNEVWASGPELRSVRVAQVLADPRMNELMRDINQGRSEVHLAFFLRKVAGDLRIKPWHQDGVYWGGEDQRVCATFLPLTPYDATHGPLFVIPGSHRLGRLFHEWTEREDYIGNSLVCDIGAFREPVLVEANPGDLVLMHSLTLHASFANQGTEDRLTLGCHWRHEEANLIADTTVRRTYGRARYLHSWMSRLAQEYRKLTANFLFR